MKVPVINGHSGCLGEVATPGQTVCARQVLCDIWREQYQTLSDTTEACPVVPRNLVFVACGLRNTAITADNHWVS
jgi:hypothetical protein